MSQRYRVYVYIYINERRENRLVSKFFRYENGGNNFETVHLFFYFDNIRTSVYIYINDFFITAQ